MPPDFTKFVAVKKFLIAIAKASILQNRHSNLTARSHAPA